MGVMGDYVGEQAMKKKGEKILPRERSGQSNKSECRAKASTTMFEWKWWVGME